jgi:hypothetical protein
MRAVNTGHAMVASKSLPAYSLPFSMYRQVQAKNKYIGSLNAAIVSWTHRLKCVTKRCCFFFYKYFKTHVSNNNNVFLKAYDGSSEYRMHKIDRVEDAITTEKHKMLSFNWRQHTHEIESIRKTVVEHVKPKASCMSGKRLQQITNTSE